MRAAVTPLQQAAAAGGGAGLRPRLDREHEAPRRGRLAGLREGHRVDEEDAGQRQRGRREREEEQEVDRGQREQAHVQRGPDGRAQACARPRRWSCSMRQAACCRAP